MIEVKNLTKYYRGVLAPAVKNVSFCANPGEFLSGEWAGKSHQKKFVNL